MSSSFPVKAERFINDQTAKYEPRLSTDDSENSRITESDHNSDDVILPIDDDEEMNVEGFGEEPTDIDYMPMSGTSSRGRPRKPLRNED
jgi:hypothetical protein